MSRLIDMTGQQFGELTVLRRVENSTKGEARWQCQCSCGEISEVTRSNLVSGGSARCEKCSYNNRMAQAHEATYVDYTGLESGRLKALSNSDRRSKGGATYVWAECSCDGGIREYLAKFLIRGLTKSCGCIRKETMRERMKALNALRSLPA